MLKTIYQGKELKQCPECGSDRLVKDFYRAEISCAHCGLVLDEELLDSGPDWRSSDTEPSNARAGPPSTLMIHDKGLSTVIDWKNKDIYGKDLSPHRRAQIYRMRKWQSRIRISDALERNLVFALSEIERLSSSLKLPKNIREVAALLYRQVLEKRINKNKTTEGLVAACVYAACRQLKIPRTLDEIEEQSRVDKKEIGRSYRFIMMGLGMKLPLSNPAEYVSRFASQLGLSGSVQTRAISMLEEALQRGLPSGRSPMGLTAAALYLASILENEKRTQRDISEVVKVTEVTVRNRYKELQDTLGIDIKD